MISVTKRAADTVQFIETIQFETREEVERWGIEQAREWIDRNVSQYECRTEEEAK